jgi:hypothetical protein
VTSVSAPSAEQSTPTAPGAPAGLTATPGSGTATLSWSAPRSDGGSPVDFYVIEGGTSNDILEKVGGHTATLAGLTNGTAYSFSVHAQNAFGDGPAVTVQVTPHAAGSGTSSGTAPGAPAGLKTSYGDGFIALSWSPPASAGSSPVTGYHVYMGFSSSFTAAREFTTSGPSFRLTDAENGSTYFIKVTAVNAAGEGPATPATSVTPVPHVTPPSPPTGLTARAGHGQVSLFWSPPPGGLQNGDGYLIYMGTSPGHEGAKPSYPHLIENGTSFTMAPLTDGTRYYFQVALLDGSNQVSARSVEVSAVPAAGGGSAASPSASSSASAPGGGGGATAPPTSSPLPIKDVSQPGASSSPPAGLIIGLAALSLAGTGGAIAIVMIQRRRKGRGYAAVPSPRRPYDDEPARSFGRTEEKSGPRSY